MISSDKQMWLRWDGSVTNEYSSYLTLIWHINARFIWLYKSILFQVLIELAEIGCWKNRFKPV